MSQDQAVAVAERLHFAGQGVFVAGKPNESIGEVYELGTGNGWFAWICPPDGYMSVRARSQAEVLAQLAKRSGLVLRARK